jgi:hypothetical protein
VLLVGLAPHGGQAQTAEPSRQLAPGFSHLKADDKLLLMPIDVELFSLSLGGVEEPRADWTEKAQRYMAQAIDARRQAARLQIVEPKPEQVDEFAEQVGLHAAVAQSIALHQFGGSQWALPSKQGRLDWSFGDAMRPLQAASGARYALFLWVRDSYASPERVAAMIALAALGVGIAGGTQIGYASLVDLETGRVLWFNLLARAYGDLREPGPARESIDALLSGFPGVQ